MAFEVYDYRTVNRNVLVSPEIRARLYHMAPGQVDRRHSHDLGHEIFLILEGQAEFNIDGTKQVLGPGQMCVALVDEIHQVRNMSQDEPCIMYLSVTPHVHPTHTGRDDNDEKLPPYFPPNSNYHVEQDMGVPLAELLTRQHQAAAALVAAAEQNLATQAQMSAQLLAAQSDGDEDAAVVARNAMWDSIYRLHKQLYAFDTIWNEVAPRAATNQPT